VSRVDNYRQSGHEFLENTCFLKAIHHWHGEIRHNQRRPETLRLLDGVATVFGFPTNFKFSLARENEAAGAADAAA
jgi:hypothetical protein